MKHLTENQQKIYDALEAGGYVKGYGPDMVRVMTSDHSPIANVPKYDLEIMIRWGAAKKQGLIYVANVPPPAMKKFVL